MQVPAVLLTLTMMMGGVRADSAVASRDAAGRTPPTGTWRFAVINGNRIRELGRRTSDAQPVSYVSPSSSESFADRAAWSLQLGIVPPSVSMHETTFGPAGGVPVAGDFNGDGYAELGVFTDGRWYIDLNANNTWDDGDLFAQLGAPGDQPVVGDWNQDGKADLGVYSPAAANEVAVVGDWDGRGIDRIGVFTDGVWTLDVNGDRRLTSSDATVRLGAAGDRPIVGDFNRDGRDELGVYANGIWSVDVSNDRRLGAGDLRYPCGQAGDTPVVGDWDGDGRDQVGLLHR